MEFMLKQIESWPSRCHADLVAALLLEGVCRVLGAAYGDYNDQIDRITKLAISIFGHHGGDGPTHEKRGGRYT